MSDEQDISTDDLDQSAPAGGYGTGYRAVRTFVPDGRAETGTARNNNKRDEQVTTEPVEIAGRNGPDPTRFGDWEINGRCIDF